MPKSGLVRLLGVCVAVALAPAAGCAQVAAAPAQMQPPTIFGHGPVPEKDRVPYAGPADIVPTPPLAVYGETAADILENLDMTSFRNSTLSNSPPGWRVPADWSFNNLTIEDDFASLERQGGWLISLRIIFRTPHGVFACFEDRSENGGAYYTRRVIWVFRGAQNTYLALESDLANPACQPSPRLG